MNFLDSPIFSNFLIVSVLFVKSHAATFDILNSCPFTVWAAALPGGGRQLDSGQTWTINVAAGTGSGRIWARTNCSFDDAGRGGCVTGDCNGLLQCQDYGAPPNTLAEYALNQPNNLDFFDITLVDGFNVPMEFRGCRSIGCRADINEQCPNVLRAPGGCNNPCTVFMTVFEIDQHCCMSGSCGPTGYSSFFKERCPNAYVYAKDDESSLFTCPGGTNYTVVFCPERQIMRHAATSATFDIQNNCPFTVWAAALPGGGRRLDRGQTWTINVPAGTKGARIWARTNCNFDGAGRGRCQTGDCNGLLQCQGYGQPPNTLAEYALNQFNNLDFFDISLVDGFNVPMEFSGCRSIRCTADISGQCPNELRAPGGCNNPCTVFKTDQYCCNSGNCGPTNYSRFFKQRCPDAFSYPKDDPSSTFTCPGGTNYRVLFCP